MAALTSHTNSLHAPQEKHNAWKKSEKDMNSKKGKAKEKSSSTRILVENATTSSYEGKEVPWTWTSMVPPAASKVSPVFTKDGRCVLS